MRLRFSYSRRPALIVSLLILGSEKAKLKRLRKLYLVTARLSSATTLPSISSGLPLASSLKLSNTTPKTM